MIGFDRDEFFGDLWKSEDVGWLEEFQVMTVAGGRWPMVSRGVECQAGVLGVDCGHTRAASPLNDAAEGA